MRTDIVNRLRSLAVEHHEMLGDIHEPLNEAADEIEQLRLYAARLEQRLDRCPDETLAIVVDIAERKKQEARSKDKGPPCPSV